MNRLKNTFVFGLSLPNFIQIKEISLNKMMMNINKEKPCETKKKREGKRFVYNYIVQFCCLF